MFIVTFLLFHFKEVFKDFIFFTLIQFQRNSLAILHLNNVILTYNDWECVEIIRLFSCFFIFILCSFFVVEFLKTFSLVKKNQENYFKHSDLEICKFE